MCGKIKVLQPYLLPYSYSLFEPNSRTLAEYGVSLEKAILRDSELLSEVNNAFCNSHPLLAQKVVTRSARAAVSKISADALLAKAISVRRSQAGSLLKTGKCSCTKLPPPALPAAPLPPPALPAVALPPPLLPLMLPSPFFLPPPPAWPYPRRGVEKRKRREKRPRTWNYNSLY